MTTKHHAKGKKRPNGNTQLGRFEREERYARAAEQKRREELLSGKTPAPRPQDNPADYMEKF